MRALTRATGISGIVLLACALASSAPADDHASIVITYKDGHHQTLATAEIARIDLKAAAIIYKDGHREKFAEIDRIEFGESGLGARPARTQSLRRQMASRRGQRSDTSTSLLNPAAKPRSPLAKSTARGRWSMAKLTSLGTTAGTTRSAKSGTSTRSSRLRAGENVRRSLLPT